MPAYSNKYVPASTSSVLLQLDPGARAGDAEVLICSEGGESLYRGAIQWNLVTASNSCGCLRFINPNPH